MTDIISDSLTRIRNAQMRYHKYAVLKCSKHVKDVLNVLHREGYIEGYQEVEGLKSIPLLKVDLKYHHGESVITQIKRVSKPGTRVHTSINDLPKAEGGLGIYIVSTSKGVLSDAEARALKVGGEIICKVF